tara:strand:+ start:599 stop:916 length:318 start_codon:yes stop_codon:yes gene_type:complete
MAKKISEDTEVKLDLKSIGLLVGGVISLASMWYTLQGDIAEINNKVESINGDEFVQKLEFSLKDELTRTTVMQIQQMTETLKEDIKENKEAIEKNSEKLYENKRR